MAAPTYTITRTPANDWCLRKDGVDHGTYRTLTEAEDAMRRLVNLIVYNYDATGMLLR